MRAMFGSLVLFGIVFAIAFGGSMYTLYQPIIEALQQAGK
jgi:hypothetical protein